MPGIEAFPFDLSAVWTFLLLLARMEGLFQTMPGLSSDQVAGSIRGALAVIIAAMITLTGVKAPEAPGVFDAGIMMICEFILGWAIGFIPAMIVAAVSVGGQVMTLSIGLGQASMIDPSLGEPVSIISSIKAFVATIIFLLIDGHHVVLRAASGSVGTLRLGLFRPDGMTFEVLSTCFYEWFQLALTISGPVLVTMLLTQFVLGLLTKFVPQVNVFIISLPLTIGLGLFMIFYTFPAAAQHIIDTFGVMGVAIEKLIA